MCPGEAIRLALHYGGLPFRDVRLSREAFRQQRDSGALKFGQLPCLELPSKERVFQSAAILRLVGKRTGLYPTDEVLAARVDALMDYDADIFHGVRVLKYKERFGFPEESFDTQLVVKALLDSVLPRHLGNLCKVLEESTTGWLAGTPKPTIADFFLVPPLNQLLEVRTPQLQGRQQASAGTLPVCLTGGAAAYTLRGSQEGNGVEEFKGVLKERFPQLQKLCAKFFAEPAVAEYYAARAAAAGTA